MTKAQTELQPNVEEYATLESITNGVPVWSFSNLTYIYGISPDLMPGQVMQEDNSYPAVKINPKKSWEIKYNLAGAESEMTVRDASNDSQPMLPIHLIDGDPETMWTSMEYMAPDSRPEWIRVDLPIEREIASVALVTSQQTRYGTYGKALPKQLEVKISRDAAHWETVYVGKNLPPTQPVLNIKFQPHRAKQIWVIGSGLAPVAGRYAFSVGELEVRDPAGNNVALVSRGASVTVSSTSYVMLNDRFTQNALWGPLNYDLGNKWVRIGGENGSFMWHYVEHEKGKLQIDPVADESVTQLVLHGIQVILNLDYKGNWIYMNPPRKTNWTQARFREINDGYNDSPGAADQNPEMYQGYLRYIEYMVEHFKDRVTIFEIGNEWNNSFGSERYMQKFFEPAYAIIKRVAPNAKVMLGSQALLDENEILDCLGRQRRIGIAGGRLQLDGENAITPYDDGSVGLERWVGAAAVRNDIRSKDASLSVETQNTGRPGLLLRFQDLKNYVAALYNAADHSLAVREVANGKLYPECGRTPVPEFGPIVTLAGKVNGNRTTLTISDGAKSVSTACMLQHVMETGNVGLLDRAAITHLYGAPEPQGAPQLFASFRAADAQGKVVLKDEFKGPEGTVPPGWKYVSGGPNPIKPGLAARLDAIAWHPVDEPTGSYFSSVRRFQKKCRDMGFKGEFFAPEIYGGSMYPPGPQTTLGAAIPATLGITSELDMAKLLIKSLVGHNGLGMEAGPCHPHFTAFAHPQALCQVTWGMQTLHPCRPTIGYYTWRTVATVMDGYRPAEVPVSVSSFRPILSFGFRRDSGERLVAYWLDAPGAEAPLWTELVFRGVRAQKASIIDIMNGTETALDFSVEGPDTAIRRIALKDYPVFVSVTD